MSKDTLNVNEIEIKRKIEVLDKLISECKKTKNDVDTYAKKMRTSIRNMSARGTISSTKIDELIRLLGVFKEKLEEISTETSTIKKDETSSQNSSENTNVYDKVLKGYGIDPSQYAFNPDAKNDAGAYIGAPSVPLIIKKDNNDEGKTTEPEKKPTKKPTKKPKKKTNTEGTGSTTTSPTKKPTTENNVINATTPPTTDTERETEVITQPVTQPVTQPATTAPTTPVTSPSNNNGNTNGGSSNNNGGGNYYTNYSTNETTSATTTEAPTVAQLDEDVIKEGNTYKLPTSTKITTATTTTAKSSGNSVIPVLAGLSAAAAAGIGAKAYIDRKNNRDNEEEADEFKAEDWSDNNEVNVEYQEPVEEKAETLDFDEPGYQEEDKEKYGARTQEDLENLQ